MFTITDYIYAHYKGGSKKRVGIRVKSDLGDNMVHYPEPIGSFLKLELRPVKNAHEKLVSMFWSKPTDFQSVQL